MRNSSNGIRTTHAGALPPPPGLAELVEARAGGGEYDAELLESQLVAAVSECVDHQVACGLDCVNDGELSKTNAAYYLFERLGGHVPCTVPKEDELYPAREIADFPEYFEAHDFFGQPKSERGHVPLNIIASACVEPLRYVGQEFVAEDVRNFQAALANQPNSEGFLSAITPGWVEHFVRNEYYATDEEFVFAIADAMREEYKAIVDAGLVLQIDDPTITYSWAMFPDMSVPEYRDYARVRVEALNHALRDLPEEQIRLHVCWGSWHAPHTHDIALTDIIDLVFSVNAGCYALEASNPAHEWEWAVFEDVQLPDGKLLAPGVIGHASNFVEHPELVAQRLIRYANLVGKENVIACTDCGLGGRVGDPKIAWAKFQAMRQGADLATNRLWNQ